MDSPVFAGPPEKAPSPPFSDMSATFWSIPVGPLAEYRVRVTGRGCRIARRTACRVGLGTGGSAGVGACAVSPVRKAFPSLIGLFRPGTTSKSAVFHASTQTSKPARTLRVAVPRFVRSGWCLKESRCESQDRAIVFPYQITTGALTSWVSAAHI